MQWPRANRDELGPIKLLIRGSESGFLAALQLLNCGPASGDNGVPKARPGGDRSQLDGGHDPAVLLALHHAVHVGHGAVSLDLS